MSIKLVKITMGDSLAPEMLSLSIPTGYKFIFYKAFRWITGPDDSSSSSSGEEFVAGLWAFGGTGDYERFNGFWGDNINGEGSKTLEFPHNAQGLAGGAVTPMWYKTCGNSGENWATTALVAFSTKTYNGGTNWMLISDEEGDLNSDEMVEREIEKGGTPAYPAIACNTTISADGYEVPYERQTVDGPGMPSRVVFNNCSGLTGTPPYFIWLTEPLTEQDPQPGDVYGPNYLYLAPSGTANPESNYKRVGDYPILPDINSDPPYCEKMVFSGGDTLYTEINAGGFTDNCALIGLLLDSNGVPVPEATVRSLFSGYDMEFTTYSHTT